MKVQVEVATLIVRQIECYGDDINYVLMKIKREVNANF